MAGSDDNVSTTSCTTTSDDPNNDESVYDYEYEYSDDENDSDTDENNNNNNNSPSKRSKIQTTMLHDIAATTTGGISVIPASLLLPSLHSLVEECADALCVPQEVAMILLRANNFDKHDTMEQFCNSSHELLSRSGVLTRLEGQPTVLSTGSCASPLEEQECLICMEPLQPATSLAMSCQHTFCLDCWADYLKNLIQFDGPSCVDATCPQQDCPECITEVEVQLAAPELLPKFQHYQLMSYVKTSHLLKWCPGKGCDQVAKATCLHSLEEAPPVHCDKCDTYFCMACGEEPHNPCNCQSLAAWKDKNTHESKTSDWIIVNTKNCPKCSARIQKDGGCLYVTCRACNFGFCWKCMGSHHVWQCNAFIPNENAETDEARAKNELERYLHYYERFHLHDKAQVFAQRQLARLIKEEHDSTNGCESLLIRKAKLAISPTTTTAATTTGKPSNDGSKTDPKKNEGEDVSMVDVAAKASPTVPLYVDVRLAPLLKDANLRLVECRRVLKFSYVFAYYHFVSLATTTSVTTKEENGTTTTITTTTQTIISDELKRQKECFEHHQGILEGLTEGLSKLTESPRSKIDCQDVANRTRVIGQFIKNVLEFVQDGMSIDG